MSFAEWTRQQQKKKNEEKQQTRGGRQVDLYADDAQTQQGRRTSQQTRTISVNAPTYSSRKPTFAEWTAHQHPDYVTNWIRDSQNLLNDTYQYSKSWSNDKTKYTNLKSRASGLLYSADWIKEMTSQDKDSSEYVGDIIDALSKAGTVRDDAQKYYSQFDTQDAYQMVQDYSTPEGRRKRYQNNKEKLALLQDELQEIQESGGVIGEGRYNPAKPWTGADTASDLRKEIAAIQAEITNYERGNTGKLQGFHSNELQSLQQQLATLKAAYNQERQSRGASSNNFLGSDSSLPVFQADAATERESELAAQIQELEKKIANASGDSFYYGNKAVDDAYFLTQNADFAENSKNRSFGNATKAQFDQYYYNAYGGEAINPKTGEVVATHRGLGYTDQSLDSLQINDPLGFWLDAEKSLESGALQYNAGGSQYREYDAILARAEANDWDQLTNDEVSVYYYLMNTQGKKAASDFLDSMSMTLQRRQTEQDIKDATALYDEANVLGKIMLNLATVPVNAISNTVGFVEDAGRLLTGQDYNPYSKLKQGQTFTQAIRGATAQDLDATGFKIPVLDFSLGDIYQAGMSVLDSALLTGTLRIAGGIEAAEKAMYFMGMGAAESEARKLYEAGASDDQIAMGAAASGIAEALFEKASIENLVSIRSPESVFEMVKNIMVQGGVEASEEAFTEIANIITNSLIMDSQSEWAQSVMEHNGDTKAAFVDKVQQVAQAAFGGFLSGAASSTLHQGAAYADRQYQNYQVGHAIQQTEGGTDALMQLAQDVSESADKKTAKKITRQGQKVVGYQKGTGIANDIRTGRLYDSTIRAITLNQANVIQKALIEAEVDPDYAKQITGAMRAQAYGLELTSAQEKALQKAGQNKTVQDVISRVTSNSENAWTSRQNQARSLAEGVIIGDARGAQTAQQLYREAEQRVSDTGHAVMKESGDAIEVKGVSSIQRGEMILNIGGGKTVNANDIQYANADQAVLYQTVANMGGIVDAQTAQKIIDNFDTSGNLSAQAYASGMRQAYMYGVYGYSASDVKNGAMSSELSGEQQVLAYTLGAQYGTVLRSHQPGLVMDDYVQENIAPDMADKINKTARLLGVRVQFADSQAVGGGDANAQLQDGVILIEKGNPNPVMAILGHEWTHQIQDLAAREYETFKKSTSSDPDVQAEASRLFDLYKRKGHPLTEDGAMDEAVANYAGRLINETDVLDKFLAENKQNKTLLQKMVDGIRKLIRKVTGAEKRQLQTVEGKLLAAMNAATNVPVMPGVRSGFYDTTQYSLKVTDEPTLSFLNGQDTITTYKTMQVIDGKLYPPMAARVGGQYEDASELGMWEMASEHPELATKDGKFKLDKGKGQGSIQAAYNPYMHSSNLVINDQFSGAYARPNLVTVECEVPASEATSNYRAENAKDTTGWHSWHTGTVAGAVRAQKGIERQVFLSRWIKPVRIIPNSEVAQMYAELLSGTDIAVPDNVVPPALLDELRLAGVPISESGRVKNDSAARFSLKAYDGVDLAENSRVYDYDFLVSLPDMEVVELPELSDLRNADNRIDTGKVLSAGMKNARAVGTERDGKTYVTNRYTGHELRIDNSTIRHGLNGSANRLFTNARISAVIGDIVGNAVPINALNNKASGVSGTYAMAAYATDSSSHGFVAIVTVEQRTGNVAGVSAYDVVHAVSGRQKRGSQADTKSQGVYPIKAASVSISDVLSVVNSTHQSILSNDVLSHLGEMRNPAGEYSNKVKFSLKESVEETKDMIAVHNVDAEKLQRALDLGGLPMPSIAIVRDSMGWEEYGPISFVFAKDSIDPRRSRANKIYGYDAWTPVAPQIDYVANSDAENRIFDLYTRMKNEKGHDFAQPLYSVANMLEHELNEVGPEKVVSRMRDDPRVMNIYLEDTGRGAVETVMRENVQRMDETQQEMSAFLIRSLGADVIQDFRPKGDETAIEAKRRWFADHGDALNSALREYYESFGVPKDDAAKVVNAETTLAKKGYLLTARKYLSGNLDTVTKTADINATNDAIREKVDQAEYNHWLDALFKDAVKTKGIYNGKDLFTEQGNRRSFSATHYEYTLENIVKAMKQGDQKGVGTFSEGQAIWGVSSKDYNSIGDVKADAGRLQQLPDEEYKAIRQGYTERLADIANEIKDPNIENGFVASENAAAAIVETLRTKHTVASIDKELRTYQTLRVKSDTASKALQLYDDIANMPTTFFEAKPQRAVGFDEVLAAIVPSNTSQVILDELRQRGVNTISYEAGNSEDRLAKLNSVENAKFSIKGSERQADLVQLQNENDLLRQQVEYWKGQTKRTESVTTDKKSVLKSARSLVKGYSSTADVTEIAEQLQSLYDFIANNGDANNELTYEDVRGRAESIAEDIVQNAVLADDDLRAQYADLRAYVRGTTLRVTDAIKDSIPDFNDWRKANFGSLRIANGNSTNIDQVYQELSYQWPEFFNEEQTGNPADQLQQIADVMQTISQVTERNPFAYDMEAAVSGVANEILENFFDLPQTKATFADKQAFKLQEVKSAGKQRLQAQQAASKVKMQQLRNENRQRVQDAITAERMNAGKQIAQLKNKYAAKTQAQKESRNAKELRAKITRHTAQLSKKLLSPTDNAHIPEQLRGPVATMLEAINQDTGYSWGEGGKLIRSEEGNPTKRTQAFQELANQYAQIMKDQNSFDGVLDPDIDEKLLDVVNLKDLRLNEMSTAQLRTVWEAVRAVEMSIQTAGKVLTEGKYQSTQEWANAFQQDANVRKTKGHITPNHFALDLETPYTFFSHFGDAGMRVYRMLRDAQDHQQRMVDQVSEEVQKIVDPKTVKKLETTRHTFKTARGDTLTLTTAQVMDLYNLMKRKQAQKHLEQGGVMQPEVKWRVGSKGPTIERGTDATLLSETDLANIVGVLTKEETKIADDLQRLTVTTLAAFGNEASMTAYGYKKFTGSDYWPIRAATEQTKTDTENNSSDKQRSIKNIGMAKSTTPGASNAVELRGVFDTFARHASDMIDYSAWLVPMEDANHLFNYRFREAETGKTLKTIKGIIERTAGKGGQRYWQNLMDDIQNGMSSTGDSNLWATFGKTVGAFKGAAVGGNIRVVIQQPTAWVRASYVLNPVNMAKGLIKGVTDGNGWAKAKKYAEIAARKDNGSFDISSPYSLDETLFDKKSTLRKTSDALSWAAGQADAITWGRLWNACEWQVHQQNAALRPGSTEFYSEVAKTFTDMIDQTQVVDGVLQRSQAMRSSNEVMKQATSFMGEPLMSLNLMMRSYDAFRYTQDKGKRKTALRKMGRAASALVMTAAVNALAQSLVDAFRDDDDDKTYAQRYLAAFTGITGEETGVLDWVNSLTLEGNFGGNLNPLTQIPFVKDYISLAQGYDVSRTEMEVVSDLIRAGQTFVQNIGGNGPKTQAYALKEVFAAGAKLFGLPVSNLTRDIWALARTIVNDSGNLPVQYQMEKAIYNLSNSKNKSRFLDLLYKALARGDMGTYQHIRSELSAKMGLDGATIDSALKARYNDQRKKDPSYSLPDTTLAMIGIRKSVTLPAEEPSFSAKDLTDAQYQVYAQQKAEDYETLISHIEKNKTFQAMSDSAKDKVYRMAYNYTDQYALADNSDGAYEVSTDWMVKAKAASKKGTKVWDYLVDYVQNSEDNTAKNEAYTNMYTALENGDIKEYQRIRNQVMRELELNGTDINSAMKSKYNAAKKANPSYKLDQKVLDLLGIVEKRGTSKSEEETFSAGNLSSSAYTSYETQRSTEYRQTVTGVSGSSWFRGLDADDQDKVYAFAYQLAEEEALKGNSGGEYEISTKWIKEAANAQYYGLEDWQYTLFHSAYALATTDRDASGKAIKGQGKADKVRRWLNEQNLTEEQRAWLWSTVYSSEW